MFVRSLRSGLMLGIALALVACSNPQGLDSVQVTSAVQTLTVGQTAQFTASGTFGNASRPTTKDVTTLVTWSSSTPSVATVSSSGLVTAVGVGSTIITASATGFNGPVSAGATLSVTASGSGSTSTGGGGAIGTEPLISINIVPGGTTVSNKGMTGQYLAFGTYSTAPYIRDLTNVVTWISLLPEVASINTTGVPGEVGGLATAMGYTGNAVIYAEATNPDGTIVLSNPQTFTCKDPTTNACEQAPVHPQFATITVFHAGSNTTNWLVTAPSDTGVPNLIHCGPGSTSGGSVCTGVYETGSTITLTASPTGTGFGGWSSGDGAPAGVGCLPVPTPNPPYPATCTVTLTGNTSIGVIFY